MKILMVLEGNFPPDVRVEKEIKSLINSGHKIVLACSSPKAQNMVTNWNGAEIIKKRMSKLIYKSSVAALKVPIYFNYWQKFLHTVIDSSFDAIHLHDLPLSKVVSKIARNYNIPFVLDLHENWPAAMEIAVHTNTFLGKLLSSNKKWQNYEKKMTAEATKIITVVDEMKNRIIALGNLSNKIIVLPNSIKLSDQKNISLENVISTGFTLFYAGGINIHRGLQVLLKAIDELKTDFPTMKLLIVGDGSYRKNLNDYVKNHKLEKFVKFFGWKSYAEMMKILIQADIAVIPHLRSVQTDNSSPNKLYQYSFLKKPILASDCNSLKRIIDETKSGITYQADDFHDLAKKITMLFNNKELQTKLGNAGYESVIKTNNWENNSKTLIKMYKELEEKK